MLMPIDKGEDFCDINEDDSSNNASKLYNFGSCQLPATFYNHCNHLTFL